MPCPISSFRYGKGAERNWKPALEVLRTEIQLARASLAAAEKRPAQIKQQRKGRKAALSGRGRRVGALSIDLSSMMEPEHTENITEEKPLLSDDSVGITINDDNNGKIVLKVKTLSEKPLRVEISPSASVGEFKELVKKKANAEGKFLRLIHQGKMLSDDKVALESCKVKSEDFIHCAISSAPPKAVVNQMAATDSEPEERDDPTTRRGFDRLRDRLSREEIQALRLYFYPQLSVYISQAVRVPGESSEDRIYRLEEEWMASQGPQSEFALNVVPTARIAMDTQIDVNGMNNSILAADNEGTGTEFLWGFLMGLLLGVFMLLMLLDRSVPRKQKVGLLLGVSMNFFLSVVPRAVSDQ